METEAPPDRGAGPVKGAGNVLTRKLGPLPVWGWALAAGAAYLIIRRRSGGTAAPATGGAQPIGAAGTLAGMDNPGQDSFLLNLQSQLNGLQKPSAPGAETTQSNNVLDFLGRYSADGGPITLDQARAAVENAYISLLGRKSPPKSADIDYWAGRIVREQSYQGALLDINASPEGDKYRASQQFPQFTANPIVSSPSG